MKTLSLLLIMSIAMVSFSNNGVERTSKEENKSSLTIKGESLTTGEYTYEVYVRINEDYKLVSSNESFRGKYKISIDSGYDYKILFTNGDDETKVMYVNRAYPDGEDYKYQIDVDFRFGEYFAELEKRGKKYKHAIYTY